MSSMTSSSESFGVVVRKKKKTTMWLQGNNDVVARISIATFSGDCYLPGLGQILTLKKEIQEGKLDSLSIPGVVKMTK